MATVLHRHEYGLPASRETIEHHLHNETAIRIVTVIDIASLSTLELLEYGLTKQDIQFAFVNGLVDLDMRYINAEPDPTTVSRIVNGKYDYWNSRKFVLSSLGLFLLESLRSQEASLSQPHNIQSDKI